MNFRRVAGENTGVGRVSGSDRLWFAFVYMEINQRESGEIVILDVSGEINLFNAPEIKEMIDRLINDQKYRLVVNLEKVNFIDSSGLGALISGLTILKKHEGGLRIINISKNVQKTFELTNLTSFFGIYETEAEAIASYSEA